VFSPIVKAGFGS